MQYGNFGSSRLDICASEYTSPILARLVISLVKNDCFPRHVVPRQNASCASNFLMQNVFPAQKCTASILKFTERMILVDKSILGRGVTFQAVKWRDGADWGPCIQESRRSQLNSHHNFHQPTFQKNHPG